MIIISTRVAVTVLARGIRPVQPVVGVQRRQMVMVVVVVQHGQVRVVSTGPGSVGAQSQVSRAGTGRAVVVAAVASIAAARVRHVVVQRGQLVVVMVVHVSVAVGLDSSSAAAAQNVVDHEAGAGRLQDRHRAPLNWHCHLGRCGATGAEL